ncbi:MAG: mechanosensitive ion channel family protein [Proteobacteria bacterium]|nr:mechanosensitive ion channel family protein [Pseudomonadota bacterium]
MMNETLRELWRPETPYLIGTALVLVLLLARFRPEERGSYLNTLWLFVLGMAGRFGSAMVEVMDYPRVAEVLIAVFTVVASIAFVRLSGFALFRLVLPVIRLRTPRIIEDLIITAAYAVLALIHLRGAGLDLSGILATSAVVTAVLAFAMQDTLGNVLGGLALQLDNSIRVGDWIKVDDVVGCVTDIRWRFTSVETRNWETVVIPNSVLMKGKFQVLGKREGQPVQWRRWIHFHVDPGVPPARVIAAADSAIREAEIPDVAQSPLPNCVLMGFEEGNLHFALRYWLTDLVKDDPTDSAVRVHLFTAFQRIGVRISEPQQTVHLVEEDEAHAEAVRKREMQRRLIAVKGVDLFSSLSESERAAVVERLQYAPFARGDVLTKQGKTSHWLYIIVSGEAEIVHEKPDGTRLRVGSVVAGGFFGEMGLLTGAPRTATVIATTDVECYRLDKDSFQGLLTSRPELAEDISRIVAERQQNNAVTNAAAAAAGQQDARGDLLAGIRKFFGLGA